MGGIKVAGKVLICSGSLDDDLSGGVVWWDGVVGPVGGVVPVAGGGGPGEVGGEEGWGEGCGGEGGEGEDVGGANFDHDSPPSERVMIVATRAPVSAGIRVYLGLIVEIQESFSGASHFSQGAGG